MHKRSEQKMRNFQLAILKSTLNTPLQDPTSIREVGTYGLRPVKPEPATISEEKPTIFRRLRKSFRRKSKNFRGKNQQHEVGIQEAPDLTPEILELKTEFQTR